MHSSCTDRPMYTGMPAYAPYPGPMPGPYHPPVMHGFCPSCCHPRSHCMCHRQCRKEAKELLVTQAAAGAAEAETPISEVDQPVLNLMRANLATNPAVEAAAVMQKIERPTRKSAFIGGGCCVHLSVEYMLDNPQQPGMVAVAVADSEGTTLYWLRVERAGTPYQIKESIISTKPGAKLTALAVNATARVRWCEIFSC